VWKKRTKKLLLKNMPQLYDKIEREHDFSRNDFPPMQHLKNVLLKINWNKLRKRDKNLFAAKDVFVRMDIPLIVTR